MNEDRETAAEVARKEAARQGVILLAMVIAIPLIAYLERKASDPDAFREWRMRGSKAGERVCASVAAFMWHRAEEWRLAYEAERGSP